MAVEEIPVGPSSQITSPLLYDPDKLELTIRFANGWVYVFQNVDMLTIKGFSIYESPGKYWNSIKKQFDDFERIQ